MSEIVGLRYEFPMLRTPISLMIDDWGIGFPSDDTNDFVGINDYRKSYDFMRDMVMLGREGLRGKITVLPYTTKKLCDNTYKILGRIDEDIKGVSRKNLLEILNFIGSQVMKYFDITPEILTHSLTLDIERGKLLDETEWEWSQKQSLDTLIKYIAHGLEILNKVGIIANGVTSPCNFGMEIEGVYAKAILEAEKMVNGIPLTWYFLHVEPTRIGRQASLVKPRLIYLDEKMGEAVVSIVSGSTDYLGKKYREQADLDISRLADNWITSNGEGGRLAELYRNKAYLIFHTHWYNIYGDNKIGVKVLRKVMERLNKLFGRKIMWMKCNEISRYFAVIKTLKIGIKKMSKKIELDLYSPFSCPYLTISFKTCNVRRIKANEIELRKIDFQDILPPNSWTIIDNRIYLCINLKDRVKVTLDL